jgi:hypothetical protein
MTTRTPSNEGTSADDAKARRERTGHADTPRQDSQRPTHADHADAGGQESTTARAATTQRPDGVRPAGAPPVPGELHADPPLPRDGRQPQRPGQDGRAEDRIGGRDQETFPAAKDAPRARRRT